MAKSMRDFTEMSPGSGAGRTWWAAKGQAARGKMLAGADFPLLFLAVFSGLWLAGLLKC